MPNILKGITTKNSNLSSSILKNISNLLFRKKIIFFNLIYYYIIVKFYSIFIIKKFILFLFTLYKKYKRSALLMNIYYNNYGVNICHYT